MPISRLSDSERDAALARLPEWRLRGDGLAIERRLRFADFGEAWAFLTRVALIAERLDHHPDWSNSWNRVDVFLTTHSADDLTRRDIDLARSIDAAAALALPPGAG